MGINNKAVTEIKVIKIDLPSGLERVELHVFADLHLGDSHCDISSVKERIAYVRDTDNAYCILNGDLVNNATKTSISDSYSEQLSPMEQIEQAVSLFAPIQNKILCINSGNHELRTYKKEGIDLTAVMARELGLYERFSPAMSMIFLRFGKSSRRKAEGRKTLYTILSVHGSGGGRKEGAKAIRLADMACIADADIYIHSHTHLPMIMKQSYFRVSESSSGVYPADKLFVNTAASLRYGGYGEAYEYKPSSTDTPVIYLDGTIKKAVAKL